MITEVIVAEVQMGQIITNTQDQTNKAEMIAAKVVIDHMVECQLIVAEAAITPAIDFWRKLDSALLITL